MTELTWPLVAGGQRHPALRALQSALEAAQHHLDTRLPEETR